MHVASRTTGYASAAAVLLIFSMAGGEISAQQATIATPYRNVSNSFYEHNNVSWSGNWGGASFQFGNSSLANPQFGGYKAGSGLATNFAINSGKLNVNFHLNFDQGATTNIVSQTPSVTVMNGQTGYMSDTSITPFVIGQIPVVGRGPIIANMPGVPGSLPGVNPLFGALGDAPPAWGNPHVQQMLQQVARPSDSDDDDTAPGNGVPAPAAAKARAARNAPVPVAAPAGPAAQLFAAQASSAGRAAPSIAEARRIYEKEKAANDGDLTALLERAQAAEEDGKPGVAKIYYQMVFKRATGELKAQAQEHLDALRQSVTGSAGGSAGR